MLLRLGFFVNQQSRNIRKPHLCRFAFEARDDGRVFAFEFFDLEIAIAAIKTNNDNFIRSRS